MDYITNIKIESSSKSIRIASKKIADAFDIDVKRKQNPTAELDATIGAAVKKYVKQRKRRKAAVKAVNDLRIEVERLTVDLSELSRAVTGNRKLP